MNKLLLMNMVNRLRKFSRKNEAKIAWDWRCRCIERIQEDVSKRTRLCTVFGERKNEGKALILQWGGLRTLETNEFWQSVGSIEKLDISSKIHGFDVCILVGQAGKRLVLE
jgi:hypothetical protein